MPIYYQELMNLYDKVKIFLERGLPDDAKKLLDNVPVDSSDNLYIEYLQGVCEQELGNPKRAIRRYKYVVTVDPGFISAAESLIHLDNDNMSNGELKYLYELILKHKPYNVSMREFVDKYKDVPSVPPLDYSLVHKQDEVQKISEEKVSKQFSDLEMTSNNEELPEISSLQTADALEDIKEPEEMVDPIFGLDDSKVEDKVEAEAETEDKVETEEEFRDFVPEEETQPESAEEDVLSVEETDNEDISEDEDEGDIDPDLVQPVKDILEEDIDLDALEEDNEDDDPFADIPDGEVELAVAPEIESVEDIHAVPEVAASKETTTEETFEDLPVETEDKKMEDVSENIQAEETLPEPEPVKKEVKAAKKKNDPADNISVEEDKMTGERIIRVETFTMAEIYIKQGLYHEALQILKKLKERSDEPEKIDDTIEKVNLLLEKDAVE